MLWALSKQAAKRFFVFFKVIITCFRAGASSRALEVCAGTCLPWANYCKLAPPHARHTSGHNLPGSEQGGQDLVHSDAGT